MFSAFPGIEHLKYFLQCWYSACRGRRPVGTYIFGILEIPMAVRQGFFRGVNFTAGSQPPSLVERAVTRKFEPPTRLKEWR
jgi:hypothetical protein